MRCAHESEVASMTQTTPGTGDYGPEASGHPGSTAADYRLDPRERPGFHIGSHPMELALTAAAGLLAALGAVLIAWPGAHIVGAWVSLVGILVGLYAQLTSDTTAERMVNVCAIG